MTEARSSRSEAASNRGEPGAGFFAAAVRINFAYSDALFHAGVLTRLESERVKNALQSILKRAEFDRNYLDKTAGDIHSFIETRLVQLVGETGDKINVGRSRHEQEATALRFWLREEIERISRAVRDLQAALIDAGERQKEAVLPAYAHRQKTQPILWAHWCLAYFEMFARDRERLDEVWRRVNILPLGAGVLAGTAFEIDREEIARALDFEGVAANSLDAVSDADFAVEVVGACALTMTHLSRLAEELILYNSAEFGFIELTGVDSASAQSPKKSVGLETVRGKAGRIFGHQIAILSTMKNLPLGIHGDWRENREIVFETIETLKFCLTTTGGVLKNLRLDEEKTKQAATVGYLNADDLIDYLRQRDVPLGAAKKTADELEAYTIARKKELNELSLEEMRQFSEIIGADVFEALSLEQSLGGKNQIGGTSPERVFEALDNARTEIERENE